MNLKGEVNLKSIKMTLMILNKKISILIHHMLFTLKIKAKIIRLQIRIQQM